MIFEVDLGHLLGLPVRQEQLDQSSFPFTFIERRLAGGTGASATRQRRRILFYGVLLWGTGSPQSKDTLLTGSQGNNIRLALLSEEEEGTRKEEPKCLE